MAPFDDVKARVQPALEQDFDALYEEFADETGERDVARFLDHLLEFGLISDELRTDALRPPPAPPPEDHADPDTDEVGSTVVLGDALLAQVAAADAAPDPDPIAPPQLDPQATIDLYMETPQPPRRTMFRRITGGQLQETGVQDVEERQEKRRRRREAGDTTDIRRKRRKPVGPENDARYTFLGTVGEGAMGRIHLAEDGTLHRKVAYKAMSEEIAEQATLASKFTAEAQITAQLDHPNIVPVYNLEGDSAYTMKLIKGQTVEEVINETKALFEAKRKLDEDHSLLGRLELFLRACDAMFYAHSRGVVHRDLKPENIMVGAFRELYVMDWGIARVMDGPFEDKVQLGAPPEDEGDLIIGTPGYMSPEQAEGLNHQLDGRSDQYALGLILFELVALKPAVTGKAPLKIVMRHQDAEKEPLVHAYGEAIPPEIVAIIHKATRKALDDRYENVRAMADDVRRYLRGEAVAARPDTPKQKVLRFMGRHRELTLFVIFMLVLGSAALLTGVTVVSQLALASQRAREQQLSNLLTVVARQGSLIDGQFLKYEGLLSVIATTAVDNLGDAIFQPQPVYLSSDYDDAERRPEGMIASSRYGMPVSLSHSTFVLPDPADAERLHADMQRLRDLDKHFYRVLLRSHSEQAATYTPKRAERALAEVGVPVAWAYVGLDNGVYTTFPGHGGFPDGFDHRESPWYELAKGNRGPTWGAPSLDVSGMGLVLSCAQSLFTDDEDFLGVAGVDVSFDYIIGELLEAPEFKGAENIEAFLLDPEGRVAVRSSKKGKEFKSSALRNRTIRMPDFHHAEVVEAVKQKRSGSLKARGPEGMELVLYNRMNSIGWYYVVAGDVNDLLARGG